MKNLMSRREALKNLGLGAGALIAVGAATGATQVAAADAAVQPHVAPSDPTAVALGYVENAQNLDPKKNPPYKPGEKCGNCVQSVGKGKEGDAWIGCNLFPGKMVGSQGWCKVYVART